MLPELMVHALTGEAWTERTSAGTTQLVDLATGDWSDEPDETLKGQVVRVATGDAAWWMTLDRDAVTISDDGAEENAILGGAPPDVFLWLWGRAPDEQVTRSGEEEAIRSLRSRLVAATQ